MKHTRGGARYAGSDRNVSCQGSSKGTEIMGRQANTIYDAANFSTESSAKNMFLLWPIITLMTFWSFEDKAHAGWCTQCALKQAIHRNCRRRAQSVGDYATWRMIPGEERIVAKRLKKNDSTHSKMNTVTASCMIRSAIKVATIGWLDIYFLFFITNHLTATNGTCL